MDACRGRTRVIAINDAYRLAPWADALYAADAVWWKWHQGVPSFTGMKFAIERGAAQWPGVSVLDNTGEQGLERDPKGLRTGMNSGYQAINLAVHFGAVRVVLLGYDMQKGADGRRHWFGDHPRVVDSPFAKMIRHFDTLVEPLAQAGVTVLNATRRTALTAFPCVSLEEALA